MKVSKDMRVFVYFFLGLAGISCGGLAKDGNDWTKLSKTDQFTDEVYFQYRSPIFDGQYMTLACGDGPRGRYYEPDLVFHGGKENQPFSSLQIKIRVDSNELIQGLAWHKDIEQGGYSINLGNNGQRNKEIVDQISAQFKSGSIVLIQQGNKKPIKISLNGFSEAYEQTHKLCQSSSMEYRMQRVWLK